jgi:hypothetical protein
MSPGRRDECNIAKKKRTSSCATGLRNLGESARNKRAFSSSGNGKIAGDGVKDMNHGKKGWDGENGLHNDGKDDGCNDRKDGRREGDDSWVFSIDSDSDNEGDCKDGKDGREGDRRNFDVDSDSDNEGDSGGYDGPGLPDRLPREFLPSQRQAMRLLSMAVPPEDRAHFKERFHAFATGKETCPVSAGNTSKKVCNTKDTWIAAAYGCNFVQQLRCAADMFPFSGMESCFLSEVYVMDVILNRSPFVKTEASAKLPSKKAVSSVGGARMMSC